jgi:hypothetical protein
VVQPAVIPQPDTVKFADTGTRYLIR